MKNIVLVGFMGTGKTAVAKALAKKLKRDYVSTDELIERREGMKISDIFAKKGEAHFRDVESSVAKEVSRSGGKVIDAGGGIVLKGENVSSLKSGGIMVCLTADVATILKRTAKCLHRPLLNVDDPRAKIEELLAKRQPHYAKADYRIDTTNLSVVQVVDRVIEIALRDAG